MTVLVGAEEGVRHEKIIRDYFPMMYKNATGLANSIATSNITKGHKQIGISKVNLYYHPNFKIKPPLVSWTSNNRLMDGGIETEFVKRAREMLIKESVEKRRAGLKSIRKNAKWRGFAVIVTEDHLGLTNEGAEVIGFAAAMGGFDEPGAILNFNLNRLALVYGKGLLAHEMGHSFNYLPVKGGEYSSNNRTHSKVKTNIMYPMIMPGQNPDSVWAEVFGKALEKKEWEYKSE
ncbi:MAG: hypothetical protein H8E27_08050 [Verrucomicrobia subdivision 3 bacterium]|nr:hypothetical protein [Limisphaerales bacterium]